MISAMVDVETAPTPDTTDTTTEAAPAPATDAATNTPELLGTGTYSPEDNKLRFYPFARLSKEDYARVKAAGFSWAPQQKLFVAPMWTPARADLLTELAGDIGDEDTSLVDRAEERSERFEGYRDNRKADADTAHAAVESLANGIPLGQPILIGHHSERHARRDAEKIENGMRKAVKMWETSQYWERRAAGALAHAKYKELPTVRARRIKTIIADIRRCKAAYTPDARAGQVIQARWNAGPDAAPEPHVYCGQGRARHWVPVASLAAIEAGYRRWIAHYENRLAYEKAMLNEQGAGKLLEAKPRPKQLPLLNYKAESVTVRAWGREEVYKVVEMTSAQYQNIYEDYRGTSTVNGTHRVRTAIVMKDGSLKRFPHHSESMHAVVFLTDAKTHTPPAIVTQAPTPPKEIAPPARTYTPAPRDPDADKFGALKDSLKAGVTAFSANQLFPTPPEIVRQLMDVADITGGQKVLEPSAGTGNILDGILNRFTGADCGRITAEEINFSLAERLKARRDKTVYANESNYRVVCADFLDCVVDAPGDAYGKCVLGRFDRVVMNPPFERGADIVHILHARKFLKPGGRLAAVCANGPRQRDQLQAIAETWIDLPPGSFEASGTGVNTAIVVLVGPGDDD